MSDVAEVIGVVRDIALIAVLLMAMVVLLVTYRKLSSALESIKRTIKSAEDISDALSTKIVGPATAGSGIASSAGKMAGFLFGLLKKSKSKGGKADG
jgi:uncharacterized protein YoxC